MKTTNEETKPAANLACQIKPDYKPRVVVKPLTNAAVEALKAAMGK